MGIPQPHLLSHCESAKGGSSASGHRTRWPPLVLSGSIRQVAVSSSASILALSAAWYRGRSWWCGNSLGLGVERYPAATSARVLYNRGDRDWAPDFVGRNKGTGGVHPRTAAGAALAAALR